MSKGHGNEGYSSLIAEGAREHARSYQNHHNRARRQKQEEDFFSRSFNINDFIFSPPGYEGPVMALYAALVPYLAGLAFLFVYVAESQFEYFVELSLASVFVIWAIGYEVCAGLLMAGITLAWIRHRSTKRKKNR